MSEANDGQIQRVGFGVEQVTHATHATAAMIVSVSYKRSERGLAFATKTETLPICRVSPSPSSETVQVYSNHWYVVQ